MGSPEESEPEPRSRSYRRLLFILLMPAALFNTYDSELRALLLTQIKGAFHVGVAALGIANIPIGAGQFIAFFVVLSADRIGRRPILLWSILGYTIFTSLTAVSWNLWSFATFQFFSQVFIGAEFGVAVTLLAEEVPPAERGRALAKLLLFSPVGAILGGLLLAVGFLHNPIGWRGFYLLATVPLLIVAALRPRLEESRAFVIARRREQAGATRKRSAKESFEAAFSTWRGGQRSRIVAVGAVAFLQGLPATAAIGWWTYYAEHERHLSTSLAGYYFSAAAVVSVGGYVLCGWLMDRIGRRPTAIAYVLGAVGFGIAAFQSSNHLAMLAFLLGTAFFGVGVAPVLSAFATELFPTTDRAQASAWIRNGFGNTGSLLGPAIVGVIGASGGLIGNIGDAVSLVTLLALPIVVIVWFFIPETKDIVLEDVA